MNTCICSCRQCSITFIFSRPCWSVTPLLRVRWTSQPTPTLSACGSRISETGLRRQLSLNQRYLHLHVLDYLLALHVSPGPFPIFSSPDIFPAFQCLTRDDATSIVWYLHIYIRTISLLCSLVCIFKSMCALCNRHYVIHWYRTRFLVSSPSFKILFNTTLLLICKQVHTGLADCMRETP